MLEGEKYKTVAYGADFKISLHNKLIDKYENENNGTKCVQEIVKLEEFAR